MLASRAFMTSVIVGKDLVPRIGLNQLEILRQDIMSMINKSSHSKVSCRLKLSSVNIHDVAVEDYCRELALLFNHRGSWGITCPKFFLPFCGILQPLSPLGELNQRLHTRATVPARQDYSHSPPSLRRRQVRGPWTHKLFSLFVFICNPRSSPVYQAVWADNKDFDQVLISKRMIQVIIFN